MGAAEDKRRSPRIKVEFPVEVRLDESTIHLQSADFSSRRMQLVISSSDIDPFVKSIGEGPKIQEQEILFEIRLPGRLAWIQSGPEGPFNTGWEFSLQLDEERIG